MNLSDIADNLSVVTRAVKQHSKADKRREQLALIGKLVLEAIGTSPDQTSPQGVADQVTQMKERIAEYNRDKEINRLTEMIDKLPKCWRLDDNGVLVQDVVVMPGMVLWYCGTGGPERIDVLSLDNVESSWPATVLKGECHQGQPNTYRWAVRNCYTTREAAERTSHE
jgi:hypothetical protein